MTSQEDSAAARISNLIDKLATQPDTARASLQGRATSRSEQNLHLATSTGLVAIPIGEIEDVRQLLPTGDPNLVSVTVKDNSKVRHLMNVQTTMGEAGCHSASQASIRGRPVGGGVGGGGVVVLPPTFPCDSFTNEYIDTTTESYGFMDATDDVIPVLQCDDVRA